MKQLSKRITSTWGRLRSDALLRNSLWLMMATGLMAVMGFGFWTICARLFSEEQVGLATTLLAVLNVVTSLSLVGLEIALIRVLSNHADRSRLFSASLTLTSALGVVFGAGFVLFEPWLAPGLGLVRANAWTAGLFVGFVVVSIAGYLVESAVIALRQSQYVLQKGLIFSVLKLLLPWFLVPWGAFGIYTAWMAALLAATVWTVWILMRRLKLAIWPQVSMAPLRGLVGYALANYISSFAEGLPIMVLPLLVFSFFGPVAGAHYYMAMTLANLLYTVPVAATQSLFAEGSHDEAAQAQQQRRVARLIGGLLIPGMAGLIITGPFILSWFGHSYARAAYPLLVLLALAAVLVAANSIARTRLKLRYQSADLVWVSLVGAAAIVGLCFPLRPWGLAGIGWAWLAGQLVMLAGYGWALRRYEHRPAAARSAAGHTA